MLTRPVCAFITFESDDGYNTALSYSKKKKWYHSADSDHEDDEVQQTIFNVVPHFV